MPLPRTSIPNAAAYTAAVATAGFTLIELLVVIALAAIFFSFTILMGTDAYRSYGFRAERDSIVTALQTARSQATSNVCDGSGCTGGQPHGVLVETDKFTIFQGPSFAGADHSHDRVIQSRYTIDLSGSTATEYVFTQLSGNASPAGVVKINDSTGHSSDISINSQGQITWTK